MGINNVWWLLIANIPRTYCKKHRDLNILAIHMNDELPPKKAETARPVAYFFCSPDRVFLYDGHVDSKSIPHSKLAALTQMLGWSLMVLS